MGDIIIRKPTEDEFNTWFEKSCINHANDRMFIYQTDFDTEIKNVYKMVDSILPNGKNSKENYFWILDTKENQNIGFIWFGKIPNIKEEETILLDIQIMDTKRGLGYGRRFLTKAQEMIKDIGYKRIYLNVMERNFAKDLYESLGYKTVTQHDKSKIMALDIG